MDKKTIVKQKWISEAAYYKSLERKTKTATASSDWIEAEQDYQLLINKRVKSGLVRLV